MHIDTPIRRLSRSFNDVIKILIVSDFLVWSGANLTAVVFPIFVVNKLEGGSLEAAGLSTMIYLILSSIATIPFGMIMDRIKGYVDEVNFLMVGTLVRGILLFLFAYITQTWHLHILQAVLGITRAAMFPSWRILFSKYADKSHEASQWSFYDATLTIGMGVTAYLGSFVAEEVSIDFVYQLVAAATILGGILLFTLKMYIPKKK